MGASGDVASLICLCERIPLFRIISESRTLIYALLFLPWFSSFVLAFPLPFFLFHEARHGGDSLLGLLCNKQTMCCCDEHQSPPISFLFPFELIYGVSLTMQQDSWVDCSRLSLYCTDSFLLHLTVATGSQTLLRRNGGIVHGLGEIIILQEMRLRNHLWSFKHVIY
jgi:hypothetical protein